MPILWEPDNRPNPEQPDTRADSFVVVCFILFFLWLFFGPDIPLFH